MQFARRALKKDHKMLTAEERATKFVLPGAPILCELKAVSTLVGDLISERASPGNWQVSYRDGVKLIVESVFQTLFVKLKGND